MEHANSSIAFDGAGRLYVLNTQLGTYRLNVQTGAVTPYASPFPDLKPCVPIVGPPPCSPIACGHASDPQRHRIRPERGRLRNRLAAGDDLAHPGGRRDAADLVPGPQFAGPYIGVNGLRLNPAGTRVYVTCRRPVSWGLRRSSRCRWWPSRPRASCASSTSSPPGELPDGIAFGAQGDIYVAMATLAQSGVTILRPDGTERARLRNKLLSPFAPYDGPANIAFDGAGRILLTNHAPITGLVLRKFSVVDVDVDDPGAPLFTP